MAVGGYDCHFVNSDLPKEFYCLICTFVPRQPHQVTCCGKIYYKRCLDELKSMMLMLIVMVAVKVVMSLVLCT